jgi:hypothetical protein
MIGSITLFLLVDLGRSLGTRQRALPAAQKAGPKHLSVRRNGGKPVQYSRFRAISAALAASIAFGCHSGDSSEKSSADLRTSEMWLDGSVFASDDVTATTTATLFYPAEQKSVSLGEGDTLTACVGSVCQRMAHRAGSRYGFEATLPYVAETAYSISFSRRADVSALNTVTLPVSFAILTPAAGITVTDGQPIDVMWSPSGVERDTTLEGRAHCDHPNGEKTDRSAWLQFRSQDIGAITFTMDDIMSKRPFPVPANQLVVGCRIELEVTMVRRGIVDSAFQTGTMESSIRRSVTLQYLPSQP